MPIAELGYRHWEGTRVPAWRRWLAILRTDAGVAYRGSRLLRRVVFLAWMPLLYFGPLFFAFGTVVDPRKDLAGSSFLYEMMREFVSRGTLDLMREHPELFLPSLWAVAFYLFFAYSQSILAMVVVAIVAPPLISRDVRSKAFLLYFSKPISVWEYLLGKLSVVVLYLFAITLFPALLLYLISILFSPMGGTLFSTVAIAGRIVLASMAIGIPVGMVALVFSSLTRDSRIAAFGWIAFWGLGEVAYRTLSVNFPGATRSPLSTWAFLASLRDVVITAAGRIFDLTGHFAELGRELRTMGVDVEGLARSLSPDDFAGGQIRAALDAARDPATASGIDPGTVALVYLAVLTVVCGLIIARRISRPVRI